MDGFLNIKKERGETSFRCVAAVRRITGEKKAGHGGTLDPEAEGVLPVALGKATKCTGYFLRMPKTYRAEITLGVTSDTEDIWGELSNVDCDISLVTKEIFEETLMSFKGDILQVPPMYSALKRGGVPLYKLARRGETVEREARPVTIYDISLNSFSGKTAVFTVKCSGGTYIRTLCRDIGEKLGTGAVMSALDRVSYGDMEESEAVTVSELEKAAADGTIGKYLLPPDYPVKTYPMVEFSEKECERYLNGKDVFVDRGRIQYADQNAGGSEVRIYRCGSLYAIANGEAQENSENVLLKPDKFFGVKGKTVVALGNFDGVHRGHVKLLEAARDEAKRTGADSMMYTFAEHSLSVLKPEIKTEVLTDSAKKERLAKEIGIDIVYFEKFTKEYASLTPEEFVKKILVEKLGAAGVVTGFNYTFGRGGSGNTDTLREICGRYGINVTVIPQVIIDGETVSSTLLRKTVKDGEMERYLLFAGRRYSISGSVGHGKQLGRALGFPTANVVPRDFACLPPSGVYITDTEIGGKTYHGITNVGNNPTFNENLRIETFLFDFSGDIYGEKIEVHFIKRTRGEIKFSSQDELAAQVHSDIAGGIKYFEENAGT